MFYHLNFPYSNCFILIDKKQQQQFHDLNDLFVMRYDIMTINNIKWCIAAMHENDVFQHIFAW